MLWTVAHTANYTAAQTDADIPLATDASMPIDANSHPLPPISTYLMWAYVLANTGTKFRFANPSFRGITRPYVRPIEQALNPGGRPQLAEYFRHPLTFRALEPIIGLISNAAPTGGERDFAVYTLGDGNRNTPQGDVWTAHATTTFTPVANAWSTSNAPTFDDALQPGRYSIIGMDTFAAGGVAERLIVPGGPQVGAIVNARPGVITPTTVALQGTRYFRFGYLGEFAQFEHTAPPFLEVLFTAATANPDVYWDLIQVRAGARGV